MKIARKIAHLFFPRESNNQKAKLLHSSSLTFLIFFLVVYQVALNFIPRFNPQILGYAANISPAEVIRLTNEKRIANGLNSLELNAELSQAAQAKGADMLTRGYWAHIAPDGTQPWSFITDAGYKYRYAGENLARDFSDPNSAVEAWMASPTHRENLLSAKYKDIGVAVIEGKLAGVDTTIIVQMFGAKYVDTIPAVPVAQAKGSTFAAASTPQPSPANYLTVATPKANEAGVSGTPKVLISPFSSTKSVSLTLVGILLAVLVIDGIVVARRKIVRIGGRTVAHIAYLVTILIIVIILKAGQVM